MNEFDKLLYQGSAQMPPEMPGQVIPKPWKKPMGQICWGLALISITLNFLGLNVILPVVGSLLLWLGLRSLRRENTGFRFSYVCALVYVILRLANVVLRATPFDSQLSNLIDMEWHTSTRALPFYYVLCTVVLQLILVMSVAGLWQGLKAVFQCADQKPRTAAAGGLVILEFLMLPMALIGLQGWLLVGPVLLIWLLLVWNLRKISRSLDEAGYALTPAPVRCSNNVAFGLCLGAVIMAVAIFPLCFARLPVNDTTPQYGPSVRNDALYQELIDLGFPEDLLAKLGDNKMSSLLQGAYGFRKEGYVQGDGVGLPEVITLEIPVRDERYGFHTVYLAHVYWSPSDAGKYMEGIQVTPDWQGVTVHTSCPQGDLEWRDNDGVFHTAPLSFQFHTNGSGIASYFADLSLPKDTDGPVEGWIYWEAAPSYPEKVSIFNYSVKFAHYRYPWQYPYMLPSDILASNTSPSGWRTYEWISEGQLAPEGEYKSGWDYVRSGLSFN